MNILDYAREVTESKEINCLHICSPQNCAGIKNALEELNVKVEVAKLSKKVIAATAEVPSSHELNNYLQSMQIQVKPIIKKPQAKRLICFSILIPT